MYVNRQVLTSQKRAKKLTIFYEHVYCNLRNYFCSNKLAYDMTLVLWHDRICSESNLDKRCLSPYLFAVYVDDMVTRLHAGQRSFIVLYVMTIFSVRGYDGGGGQSYVFVDTYLITTAQNVDSRSAELSNVEAWSRANNLTFNHLKTLEIILWTRGANVLSNCRQIYRELSGPRHWRSLALR